MINHKQAAPLYAANQIRLCRTWPRPSLRVRVGIWFKRHWAIAGLVAVWVALASVAIISQI